MVLLGYGLIGVALVGICALIALSVDQAAEQPPNQRPRDAVTLSECLYDLGRAQSTLVAIANLEPRPGHPKGVVADIRAVLESMGMTCEQHDEQVEVSGRKVTLPRLTCRYVSAAEQKAP